MTLDDDRASALSQIAALKMTQMDALAVLAACAAALPDPAQVQTIRDRMAELRRENLRLANAHKAIASGTGLDAITPRLSLLTAEAQSHLQALRRGEDVPGAAGRLAATLGGLRLLRG